MGDIDGQCRQLHFSRSTAGSPFQYAHTLNQFYLHVAPDLVSLNNLIKIHYSSDRIESNLSHRCRPFVIGLNLITDNIL